MHKGVGEKSFHLGFKKRCLLRGRDFQRESIPKRTDMNKIRLAAGRGARANEMNIEPSGRQETTLTLYKC